MKKKTQRRKAKVNDFYGESIELKEKIQADRVRNTIINNYLNEKKKEGL